MVTKRRVVVTGLGVAAPTGIGVEPFWDALLERTSAIAEIRAFDPSGLPSRIGGELPSIALADYIPKTYRKSAKVMSRDITIAVVCAYHAVVDAGLRTRCIVDRGDAPGPTNVDSARFGANIGAGLICADLPELAGALSTASNDGRSLSLRKWGEEGMANLTPLWLLKFLPTMLACHVTIVHDAQGPSNTITCGEASSHLAIGEAFRTIARGDADVCICGGAESKINPMAAARAQVMGRLNIQANDAPHSACRPFARDRAGTVVSEGGGLVILESLDHARRRSTRIYAELVGFGAACGVGGANDVESRGRGVAGAVRKAMLDASIAPTDVDLAIPFGVGTVDHDRAEIVGWTEALGVRLGEIPALTPRGGVGNSGAGSGAIDFAAAALAVNRNTVPPSINTDDLDPACPFRFVQTGPIDAPVHRAITNASAIGGRQSAALVLARYEE